MPTFNKQTLSIQAKELGFIRDTLEKVVRLMDILKFINNNPFLNENLALKGGTAINLFILKLPRLSVDIDLDFTNNGSKEEMFEMRNRITEIIGKYMGANDYELSSKSKQTHSLDSFIYKYTNSAGVKDNIKIEINYSLRAHILICKSSDSKMPEIFNSNPIRILDPKEIYASKIIALLTRAAPRDLYDLNNMISLDVFNQEERLQLKKCIVFYAAIAIEETPLQLTFERINSIDNYEIRTQLVPVISRNDRFNLSEAKKRVISFLTDLLILDEKEKQFLLDFSKKKYRPELLFDDIEILNRIKGHPMAIWKMKSK
jgi:predicted nucleotidyltransferase component of viral defense system